MKLGDNILKLRKQKGFSQEQLGEKVGVSRQTISNWEIGETSPNPEQLKLLSKELCVSVDELLNTNYAKENICVKDISTIKSIGMFFVHIIVGLLFILLYGLLLVMILFSIVILAISICLLAKHNIGNIIPYMPYQNAFIIALSLISLSLSAVLSSIFYYSFITKLFNSYFYKYNILKGEISKKSAKIDNILSNKKLMIVTKVALISFVILFIIAIISCIISSNSIAFWHTWNWWRK